MKRPLFAILTVLSMLLGAAIATCWVRGHWANDEIYFNINGHLGIAGSFPNHIHLIWFRRQDYQGPLIRILIADKRVGPMPIFWQPRYTSDAATQELSLPCWLLMLPASALPIWAVSNALRRRSRFIQGRCAACGYDLRASRDRCPECGEAIPPASDG